MMFSASEANLVANYYLIYRMTFGFSQDINGKCAKMRDLNHSPASPRAIRIYDQAVMNYRKKYFWTQKSDETAGFGSEIARIRIRQIRNSKVPIPSYKLQWDA